MAKDKEKSVNPAAAHRKAEKARALKKSRAQVQTQRNEKLARRNPERIQRQIDELKQLEASGDIKQREKDILVDLERDLRAVKKARETVGQTSQETGAREGATRGGGSTVLGKRQHNGDRKQNPPWRRDGDSAGDTDEEVRRIPMPEDTPPPIPREHRRYFHDNKRPDTTATAQPVAPPQKIYTAAPQIRDLKQEAVNKFVPNVVRRKQEAATGKGGLMEPEEMDRLEAEGYYRREEMPDGNAEELEPRDQDLAARRLAEEEARFEREMAMVDADEAAPAEEIQSRTRNVHIEDVDDEDG